MSFGAVAQLYERTRPGYPAEAVSWMLSGVRPKGTVLDLGAGTGKLTRALLASGFDVVAVEPSAPMREALAAAVLDARVLEGSAEEIPLPDASVDGIVVGQAYHWFDTDIANPEMARVLRPGGTLGLVWNVLDERTGWIALLGQELDALDRNSTLSGRSVTDELGAAFRPAEQADYHHVQRLTVTDLLDLVRSRSYVATLETAERDTLLRRVETLVLRNAPVDGHQVLSLPYVASTYRATRR